MLPDFLIEESVIRADGAGPSVAVGPAAGKLLVVTLGITRIIEQESLEVSIWGSPDNINWGSKPIATFPQKFYCGIYSTLLNLSGHSQVKYIRAQWKVNRWGKGEPIPLVAFYLYLDESGARLGSPARSAARAAAVA